MNIRDFVFGNDEAVEQVENWFGEEYEKSDAWVDVEKKSERNIEYVVANLSRTLNPYILAGVIEEEGIGDREPGEPPHENPFGDIDFEVEIYGADDPSEYQGLNVMEVEEYENGASGKSPTASFKVNNVNIGRKAAIMGEADESPYLLQDRVKALTRTFEILDDADEELSLVEDIEEVDDTTYEIRLSGFPGYDDVSTTFEASSKYDTEHELRRALQEEVRREKIDQARDWLKENDYV